MNSEEKSQELRSTYGLSDEDRINILVDTILAAIAEEESS